MMMMMMSDDEEGDEEEYWYEDIEHVNIIIIKEYIIYKVYK